MAIRTIPLDYGTIPQARKERKKSILKAIFTKFLKNLMRLSSPDMLFSENNIIMKRYQHIHHQVGLLRLLNQKHNNQPITRD